MEFVTRHKERDARLPEERNTILEKALADLMKDGDVLAIYLGGSLARGNFDNYSDINLHVVVRMEKKEEFIQNKRKRSGNWGNVLFYEDVSFSSAVLITHYINFVKMESWYHTVEEVKPSVWLKGLEVLHDPDELIQPVFDEASKKHDYPSAEEVNLWRSKVLAYVHETYRSTRRSELYAALANLDKVRWLLVSGWYMEKGQRIDGSLGDWSKLEGERSRLKDWQLSFLASWNSERNETGIMKTMISMFPEFLRLNSSLSRQLEMEEREEEIKQALELVY